MNRTRTTDIVAVNTIYNRLFHNPITLFMINPSLRGFVGRTVPRGDLSMLFSRLTQRILRRISDSTFDIRRKDCQGFHVTEINF